MSENHWETQPRKKNGEFTFRDGSILLNTIAHVATEKNKDKKMKNISKGGSYSYLRKFSAGHNDLEIHHMPAASISGLSKWKGPCIIMDKDDHKKTSSYGKTKRACRYRQWQAKLISEGKFLEAEYMDIKNIKRKFGNRYNKSIDEKLIYENKLIQEGLING